MRSADAHEITGSSAGSSDSAVASTTLKEETRQRFRPSVLYEIVATRLESGEFDKLRQNPNGRSTDTVASMANSGAADGMAYRGQR